MIHLSRACRGRTAVRFPANSSHNCFVELALDGLLSTLLNSKGGFKTRGFSFINPTALTRWWAPLRVKQLSVAATALMIWLCACVRYWPVVPLDLSLHYFQCNWISSIYFSLITVFQDISQQIQHCVGIGKILARWHLAIAIASNIILKHF